MAVTSGFFNSINGDRTYNAEQMSMYFEGLISQGVFESVGSRLQVNSGEGMSVNVGTGRAIVQSRWMKNDSELNLTIDPSDVQLNRIDAIAIRLNTTEAGRFVDIVVKKGTSVSGSPTPPTRATTADVYELYLAYVSVPKNTSTITQDLITDLRPSDQCGWVTGIIDQVDTSDLFDQWQTAYQMYYSQSTTEFNTYLSQKQTEFENWFRDLTQDLRVDTSLHKYRNTVTTNGETTEIAIGISEYDSDDDVLFAYVNGVYLVEGIDYIISGTGETAKIILTKALIRTNDVTFVVIKSVIGEGSGGGGGGSIDSDHIEFSNGLRFYVSATEPTDEDIPIGSVGVGW